MQPSTAVTHVVLLLCCPCSPVSTKEESCCFCFCYLIDWSLFKFIFYSFLRCFLLLFLQIVIMVWCVCIIWAESEINTQQAPDVGNFFLYSELQGYLLHAQVNVCTKNSYVKKKGSTAFWCHCFWPRNQYWKDHMGYLKWKRCFYSVFLYWDIGHSYNLAYESNCFSDTIRVSFWLLPCLICIAFNVMLSNRNSRVNYGYWKKK